MVAGARYGGSRWLSGPGGHTPRTVAGHGKPSAERAAEGHATRAARAPGGLSSVEPEGLDDLSSGA